MTLRDILIAKGNAVYTIEPEATLAEAARKMVKQRVGSLLVTRRDVHNGETLEGIITERDILYHCAAERHDIWQSPVGSVMTSKLITGSPDDSLETTMGVMTRNRIRHLPVLNEGRLVGMVSIGDVVKAEHNHLAMENRFMKDYIYG